MVKDRRADVGFKSAVHLSTLPVNRSRGVRIGTERQFQRLRRGRVYVQAIDDAALEETYIRKDREKVRIAPVVRSLCCEFPKLCR